jgi:hypothetical protein
MRNHVLGVLLVATVAALALVAPATASAKAPDPTPAQICAEARLAFKFGYSEAHRHFARYGFDYMGYRCVAGAYLPEVEHRYRLRCQHTRLVGTAPRQKRFRCTAGMLVWVSQYQSWNGRRWKTDPVVLWWRGR